LNEATYKHNYATLILQYGGATNIPKEAAWTLSEQLRAHYIMASNPEANPATILRQYGVPAGIIEKIVGEAPVDHQRRQKRSDKYQSMIDWCLDHPLEQTSVDALSEIGGVSYPTALKFINDRIDLFRKVKRGIYEVRDVKTERASVK
jgi:hypothetical protein